MYPSMPCRFPGPYPRGKLRGMAGGVSRLILGGVSQHALQVSRPIPKGEVKGSGWGCLQAHTGGCLKAHTRGGLQAHTMGGGVYPRIH